MSDGDSDSDKSDSNGISSSCTTHFCDWCSKYFANSLMKVKTSILFSYLYSLLLATTRL